MAKEKKPETKSIKLMTYDDAVELLRGVAKEKGVVIQLKGVHSGCLFYQEMEPEEERETRRSEHVKPSSPWAYGHPSSSLAT